MMQKTKVNMCFEKISEYMKYIYVIHIILAFCVYTAGSVVTTITPLLVIGLGLVVLVYRLVNIKDYASYPFIWLYVVFVVLYGISSLINIEYGIVGNIKIMMWMTLQFGTLYLCDINKDKERVTRELYNVLIIIVVMTTIMNLIGVGMLFSNYHSFFTTGEGDIFRTGVAYWGRLFGIHTDPNYGAVQTVVAIVASIFLIMKAKNKILKWILGGAALVNMMHLTFSASRTGLVSLMIIGVVYTFIYVTQKKKKVVCAIGLALGCAILIFGANTVIEKGYNTVVNVIKENSQSENPPVDNDELSTENNDSYVEIGRDEELSGDVSNRRFDLWKNALQVMQTAPIFGVTFANFVPYCQANLPDAYMLTNDYKVFNAFHNMFMDLLAGQGIVGTIVFVVIMMVSLRYLIANLKCVREEDWATCSFLFSIAVGIMASSLFVSEVLYVHNQTTVIFWIVWGYLIYYFYVNQKYKNDKVERNVGEN